MQGQRWVAFPSGVFSLGLLLLVGVGCTTSTTGTGNSTSSSSGGGMCANAQPTCRRAVDCGGGFACEVPDGGGEGCCIKIVCTDNNDCDAPATCDLRRGICRVPTCDPTNPASCPGGQVCVNSSDATGAVISQCVMAGSIAAARCEFDVTNFSLRAGETRKLNLTYTSAAGALVPFATAAFTSAMTGVAAVAADGTVTAVASGTSDITATPTGATNTCTTRVTVYGTVAPADARAVVFNSRTGKPLSGVTVLLRKNAGGDIPTVTTGADGVASFTGGGPAADIKDLSAFHDSYSWVTYVAPGSNDVAIYLDPLADSTKIAGISGTFDTSRARPPDGDIKIGLAAFSIAGALSDLNLEGLIGRSVPTDIDIPNVVTQMDVPLPSGVYLKLQTSDIKGNIDVYSDGPCPADAPCNRILWGLGGQVGLSKIGPIISQVAGGGGDLNAGAILAAVLPFFRKFYHYVGGSYSVTDITAPPLETDPPGFTPNNVVLRPNYLLSESANWTVPTLPNLPTDATRFISGALLLSGAYVPGKGFVPLGLAAGLDECPAMTTSVTCSLSGMADGKVACTNDNSTTANECEGLVAGDITLDYAPQHDGLEGYRFATVAVALDINSLGGGGSLFTSVLVSFNDSLAGTSTKTFPITSFLTFNKGSFQTRTYTATSRVTGADFYRLNLDTGGKPWLVYFNPTAEAFTVDVPPLPAGITTDRVANLDVQAFKFLPSGPTTLTQLVTFNSTNFDNLVNYTGAFSTQECTPIYPARDCTMNAQCEAGNWGDAYTCDTAAGVCVSTENGVTAKGAGACPTGTTLLTTGTAKEVCSRTPACELK